MFSAEFRSIIFQVISSWQVIAVTIAVIMYISLVSFVAQVYHRPRFRPSLPMIKKKKKKASSEPVSSADELGIEDTTNAELGLED